MPRPTRDITGFVFGRLTVIQKSTKQGKHGESFWDCRCECGKLIAVSATNLQSNQHTRSCGCLLQDTLSSRAHDLSGQVFGRLTAIYRVEERRRRPICWFCKCSCGNIKILTSRDLLHGTQSCGCLLQEARSEGKIIDLTGQVFSRLTVLEKTDERSGSSVRWLCQCECGQKTLASSNHLRRGLVKSCGCLVAETTRNRSITHGKSHTKEYKRMYERTRKERKQLQDSAWTEMMELCLYSYFPSCVVCGTPENLTADHVLPLSKGNGLLPGNAIILCKWCNASKNDRDIDQLPIDWQQKILTAAESFRVAWSGGF